MKKLYIITLICIFISCWQLLPAAVITVNQTQFANRSTHVQNQFNGVNTTINNYTTLDRAVLRRQATFAGLSATHLSVDGNTLYVNSTLRSVGIGNTAPYAPLHVGDNPVSNSQDAVILASRIAGDDKAGLAGHAFSDSSQLNRSGVIGYNSFDARTTIEGAYDYNHYAVFQNAMIYNSSGTIGKIYGMANFPVMTNGITTANYGFHAGNPAKSGAAVITNNYGLFSANQTAGANNWGLYVDMPATTTNIPIEIKQTGGGSVTQLLLNRNTGAAGDQNSIKFKASTLEMASISGELRTGTVGDLVIKTTSTGTTNLIEKLRVKGTGNIKTLGNISTASVYASSTMKSSTAKFNNISAVNAYASSLVQTPIVQGTTNLNIKSNAAGNGRITFGTSGYDEGTNMLGVGTSSPFSILTTIGNLATTAVNYIVAVVNTAVTKFSQASIGFYSGANTTPSASISAIFKQNSGARRTTDLVFSTMTSNALTERMRIGAKGNISIGNIAVPKATVDIKGNGLLSTLRFATTDAAGGYLVSAAENNFFMSSGVAYENANWTQRSADKKGVIIGSGATGFKVFVTGVEGNNVVGNTVTDPFRTALFIDYYGKIGAGTITPRSTFDNASSMAGRGRITTGSATNYGVFDQTLGLRYAGNTTTWEELRVEPTSRGGAASPTFAASVINTTYAMYNYLFANGDTSKYLYYNVQMPHSYKSQSAVYPHAHFMMRGNQTGVVSFTIACSWADGLSAGTFSTTPTAYVVSNTIAADSTRKHLIASNATPMSMTGLDISSIGVCRLERDADANAGDLELLYIDIHYEVDSTGSDTPTSKTATP